MIRLFKFIIRKLRKFKNDRYLKKHFPNIKIDKQWYENILSKAPISYCKLEQAKLKDLKCLILINGAWEPSPISQSPDYKYLISGDKQLYTKYHEYYNETQKEIQKQNHTYLQYNQLVKDMDEKGYDNTRPICVNKDNQIIDGQHRASYLLQKYGEECEITVFKIFKK